MRVCAGRVDVSAEGIMPGKGNPSETCAGSPSTSERVTLIKLGDFCACFLDFLDCFFLASSVGGSKAPSILSALEPGCKNGESSCWLLFEYSEFGVALLGEALGRRGRGNEILKLRAIVVVVGHDEAGLNVEMYKALFQEMA